MWIARLVLAATVGAAVTGCRRGVAAGGVEDPVRVESVRARFTEGDRGDFDIDFAVENRSGSEASVTAIQWEVWLGGRWFAAGTLALSEALPPRAAGRFTATLPVVFRRSGAARSEPTSIEIGVRGQLVVDTGGRVQRLAFQDRRRIKAQNVPALGGGLE